MRLQLIIIAFLAVPPTAGAENAPAPNGFAETLRGPDGGFLAQVARSRAAKAIVGNPNDCAPDRPEALWNPSRAIVGYLCSHSENGG